MTNKVYKKIKEILKLHRINLIFLFLILASFIRLPYYINGNGGIVNLDKKVIIENEYASNGSINMCYVSEYKANIYTLLYALINPYLDIYKVDEYVASNETYEEMSYREDLELEESLDNAVINGFKLAGYDVLIKKEDIYVTYIFPEASTDLKIGDKLLKIGDKTINNHDDITSYVNSHEVGSKVTLEVENDGIKTRTASIYEYEGYKYIGIYLTEDFDYETALDVKFKFDKNESGPSGGAMLTLEIYNSLISEDITKGHKIAGTGMIDSYGNILPIGGVKYKLRGAVKSKAYVFFVPEENYEEAYEEKNKHKYNIEIVSITTIDDALNYLKNL